MQHETICLHRSHFGSRYKTGCCGHAGLLIFWPWFDPQPRLKWRNVTHHLRPLELPRLTSAWPCVLLPGVPWARRPLPRGRRRQLRREAEQFAVLLPLAPVWPRASLPGVPAAGRPGPGRRPQLRREAGRWPAGGRSSAVRPRRALAVVWGQCRLAHELVALEALAFAEMHQLPPWPNGQGVGLLIRRLRVRAPPGVR